MKGSPLSHLPADVRQIVDERINNFRGFSDVLSAAIGALVTGHYYGWRGLYCIHSPTTVRKYEKILGVKFSEVMPERTENTSRLLGVRMADEIGRYWAVVKGEVTVPGGRGYVDDKDQSDLFNTG
jgi:hypothetical protein